MAQPVTASARPNPGPRTGTKGSDFAPLLREVREAGLLERRTASYVIAITLNVALLAATWAGIILLGNSWLQLLLAVPLAIFTTRAAFFGHDAGHQQISKSRKWHDWLGMLHGDFLCGMSYGWWNDKHNRHHANPNHTDKDPDVGEGVLVWTLEQAEGRTGLHGWLSRNQAKIFFPLLTLEGLNLKVSSVIFLIGKRRTREARIELGLMAAHLVLYFGALFLIMSPGKAIAFAALHHALFGLHLGSVFAPNHKGMEMPDDDTNWGHLEKQVLTSRNVQGGLVVDWLMGGLNYQIEHHLFPSMPRANLRFAQPIVQSYCERIGMPYLSTGVLESYRMGLSHMHDVGKDLRAEHAARGI
ncbi:fatty acid desaturase [Kribbella voronezhensis]|uniref:Fatty acid desaturase n=1 Tax=Kribbella voronezhensis TaxID=2512212 RepID=A0A4R7STZ6_9ACTN|nr:acyl-CoA desaturase [Kribbella voronezhensis]TDU82295.1 fatty acid desaturase [Kribbella voronezhensis]